jgi:hypothetical protein
MVAKPALQIVRMPDIALLRLVHRFQQIYIMHSSALFEFGPPSPSGYGAQPSHFVTLVVLLFVAFGWPASRSSTRWSEHSWFRSFSIFRVFAGLLRPARRRPLGYGAQPSYFAMYVLSDSIVWLACQP